ncbi:hypothetical protein BD779DRAFT_283223 [Infundibulicybe gibba]|nr:hypothetical protein BD779DRAFT_283223 [Infundibulicybe gibba]
MAFSSAVNFRIDQSTFNDARGNINYRIRNNHNRTYNHTVQGDQHINIHGEQDIRSRIHSAMENYINTDAFHDSGARRDPSRCYPGTREEALETISHWVWHPSSYCLWLHGPAGTGKSAIAQTFAEKCHQDRTLGATYFFTRGLTSGPPRGPPPIFSTLAYQLMSVFPNLDEHLLAAIHADRTIFKRSLTAQLDKLIVQPFLRLVNKSASTVVIIDGLDECDSDSIQGEIVRLILSLEQYSLPLLFLISSRPEPEIRRAFESSPRSSLLHLPLDKTMHPDHDIRYFLCKEFERIYVEMDMPPVTQLPWPSTKDIEKLVRRSSGHFIYAATVIRFVQEDHAHPMDRLGAVLNIPSESTNSSAAVSIFADSIAFRELDGLYFHILHKYQNRTELAKILHAIMHFGGNALAGDIEAIFDLRPGRVRIMLKGLSSIVDVPADDTMPLRFLHASFNDFLADPERSTGEFHLETSYFNAELAREYMRLIVTFSPSKSGYSLAMAIDGLRDCLKATADLLFDTLRKLIDIVTQKSESIPPCLLYVILDFLLRNVLNKLPGAEAARERCEIILQWLEPQLVELSDKIFTILRVLGARAVAGYGSAPPIPLEEVGQLISVPDGGLIFQQILNLNHDDLSVDSSSRWRWKPFGQIYKSLYHWLLPRHQPKKQRPSYVAVDRYTWAWAWDTYGSHYSPDPSGVDFVHYVDLVYGCLQLVLLEFGQPLCAPPIIPHPCPNTNHLT